MKITDGKKTVEIRMMVWEGSGYSPDWSLDFFDAGSLPYDNEKDVYTVEDVDYCVDQAMDWKDSKGDFRDDIPNGNNCVFVEEMESMSDEEEDTMTVVDLYNRTYKNCMFYRERNMDMHLLNEVGVLRGIVYCMEAVMGEPATRKSIDYSAFMALIKEQERLRNE